MVYQCPFVSATVCNLLYQQVLPFLFTFAIVYALILKTGILGDENKKYVRGVTAIISLVLAFFLIASTPYSLGLGTTFAQFFANVTGTGITFMTVALIIIILFGMFGVSMSELSGTKGAKKLVVPVLIILFIAWILTGGASYFAGYGFYGISDIIWTVIILGIILYAIWMVVEGGSGSGGTPKKTTDG